MICAHHKIRYVWYVGSACHLISRWFLARLIFQPWRWKRYFSPKLRLTFNGLPSFISQKILLLIWSDQIKRDETSRLITHVEESLAGEPEGKGHFELLDVAAEKILKRILRNRRFSMDCIHLIQDRVQWRPVWKTAVNLRVQKDAEFLDRMSEYYLLNEKSAPWS
jgi:hypothetical protein